MLEVTFRDYPELFSFPALCRIYKIPVHSIQKSKHSKRNIKVSHGAVWIGVQYLTKSAAAWTAQYIDWCTIHSIASIGLLSDKEMVFATLFKNIPVTQTGYTILSSRYFDVKCLDKHFNNKVLRQMISSLPTSVRDTCKIKKDKASKYIISEREIV